MRQMKRPSPSYSATAHDYGQIVPIFWYLKVSFISQPGPRIHNMGASTFNEFCIDTPAPHSMLEFHSRGSFRPTF